MSIPFAASKTRENLMRAFAGESQARNRYTFAASEAKKQKLHVVEAVFTFTANQEKEHAEIFYNLLKELSGSVISIDGSYPVDIYENVSKLLESAHHNEYEEYQTVYPAFAQIAREEGFTKAANSFQMIAEIEKTHGDRFQHLLKLLENGSLFQNDTETAWLCLNCGHIHVGKSAPMACPVCDHPQGYFVRADSKLVCD